MQGYSGTKWIDAATSRAATFWCGLDILGGARGLRQRVHRVRSRANRASVTRLCSTSRPATATAPWAWPSSAGPHFPHPGGAAGHLACTHKESLGYTSPSTRHLLCTSPTLSCVDLVREAPSLHSISTMGITTTYGHDGSRPTCHDHGGRSPWRYIHSVAGSSAVSFSVVSFFFCILSCICLNFGLTTAMMDYVHIVTLSCILLPLSMTTSTITEFLVQVCIV